MSLVDALLVIVFIVLGAVCVVAICAVIIFVLVSLCAALYPKVEPFFERWEDWVERRTGW